jgi:putative addiction module component (TIGR02574 family)
MLDSKTLYSEALNLTPIKKIELIEKLYFSLDSPDSRQQIDMLWAEEAEARIEAFDKGEIETISSEKVFAKIKDSRKNEN